MNEHHLTLNVVPSGHPGEAGTDDRFRRAGAEAELLRAHLRQGESHAGNLGAGDWEAVDTAA
jgi:hypothetical protein